MRVLLAFPANSSTFPLSWTALACSEDEFAAAGATGAAGDEAGVLERLERRLERFSIAWRRA